MKLTVSLISLCWAVTAHATVEVSILRLDSVAISHANETVESLRLASGTRTQSKDEDFVSWILSEVDDKSFSRGVYFDELVPRGAPTAVIDILESGKTVRTYLVVGRFVLTQDRQRVRSMGTRLFDFLAVASASEIEIQHRDAVADLKPPKSSKKKCGSGYVIGDWPIYVLDDASTEGYSVRHYAICPETTEIKVWDGKAWLPPTLDASCEVYRDLLGRPELNRVPVESIQRCVQYWETSK